MLHPDSPALILAPMEGVTDAPMRALQGASGAFTYAVSEFLRVSGTPIPIKVFRRDIPELENGAKTLTGVPVHVQILGGHPERMALSAIAAVKAGAKVVDINFGCPAPTVNRHDGGASLLKEPHRVREIVAAVRSALPANIPVSAKLRLGWDRVDAIHENAAMAAEGGASWITVHARTRTQGYQPPVYWKPIGAVREALSIPIVANGDIWTVEDFERCREETGCRHFMIGRGALVNPELPYQIADRLGIRQASTGIGTEWSPLLRGLVAYTEQYRDRVTPRTVMRLKQWLKMASKLGSFAHFDAVKQAHTVEEFFVCLDEALAIPLTGPTPVRPAASSRDFAPIGR